jgi:hypothetical protein
MSLSAAAPYLMTQHLESPTASKKKKIGKDHPTPRVILGYIRKPPFLSVPQIHSIPHPSKLSTHVLFGFA